MREFGEGDTVRHKQTREEGRVFSVSTSTPEWIIVQLSLPTTPVTSFSLLIFEKVESRRSVAQERK
jgi:hypothetical protein